MKAVKAACEKSFKCRKMNANLEHQFVSPDTGDERSQMIGLASVLFGFKAALEKSFFNVLPEVVGILSKNNNITITGATNFVAWAAGGWQQLQAARYLSGLQNGSNMLSGKREDIEEALGLWAKCILRTGHVPFWHASTPRTRSTLASPMRSMGRSAYIANLAGEEKTRMKPIPLNASH